MPTPSICDSAASTLDDLHDHQPELGVSKMRQQQQPDELTNEHQATGMLHESVDPCNPVAVKNTDQITGFRLLDLPFDPRRQILALVLPQTFLHQWWGPLWEAGDTALLRTCQQLHAEGTSILYSTNTFVIQISLHRPPRFIKRLPRNDERFFPIHSAFRPQDLQLIRKIELEVTGFDMDLGLGKYNIMNMGGLALGLQEEARKLLQALSQQQCGTVKVATMVWMNRDMRPDMRHHRRIVMIPLQEAGVRIEELQLSAWAAYAGDCVED